MSVRERIRGHFGVLNETAATPATRAFQAYAHQRGGLYGSGATAQEMASFLAPRICGGQLATDAELVQLIGLMNDDEMAALRAHPLTAQRIDEFNQNGE